MMVNNVILKGLCETNILQSDIGECLKPECYFIESVIILLHVIIAYKIVVIIIYFYFSCC